jgi:GPH family glycoside/pentoside/hexuronide:cation symporter
VIYLAEDKESTSRHGFFTYFSFGTYNITWTIPTATMNLFMYFYYHTKIGLEPGLIFTVIAINTVWAALNDPLIGWITDRNFKWTRKWGRRFPWIVIGFIPQSLSLIMIFSAPPLDPANPLPVMLWLLLSLFVFDLFITLVDIHAAMLRADKFRTIKERRLLSYSWTPFDMLAQVLGMMLPPLLFFFGDTPLSYTVMAAIIATIAIVFGIIFVIRGAREDETIIDTYYSTDYKSLNIFKALWKVISQRSFVGLYIGYVAFLTATTIMTNMIAYLVTFIFGSDDPDAMIPFLALFLGGALISVLLWLPILKRMKNNKRTYFIGSFILCALIVPLTFFQGDIDLMIIMFFVGIGTGSVWSIGMPVLYSDAQDDYMVRTGVHRKGMLVGTWAVIGLLTAFIDEALITWVFTITNFAPGIETLAELQLLYSPAGVALVQMGIRWLLGIIPATVLLIGTVLFTIIYPLTPEKVLENKAKLKELKL